MIGGLIARSMRRAQHHTLIFHRVMRASDPMHPDEPTADWFRDLVAMLARNFELIPLDEAVERAAEGRLSGRTLSITFDDGYADNYEVALPILQQFGAPATFFVASGFIDGGRMWNDSIIETMRRLNVGRHAFDLLGEATFDLSDWASRRHAAAVTIAALKHLAPAERQARVDRLSSRVSDLPTGLMMTTAQLRALAGARGVAIGGHTRSHPILAALSATEARAEIAGGKTDLENVLQRPITLFAYPNGKRGKDYTEEHVGLARQAGFAAAVTTDWGALGVSGDRYTIPRFTPWHRNLRRFSLDLARCHYGWI